jgi:hypothetical protein
MRSEPHYRRNIRLLVGGAINLAGVACVIAQSGLLFS